jgi:hypothetical protein
MSAKLTFFKKNLPEKKDEEALSPIVKKYW